MAKKILVIDDEKNVSDYIRSILEDNGYEVWTACDGHAAETAVKEIMPDLITLDLEMPKEWGPMFYRNLRKIEELRETPVIVISGLGDPDHAVKGAVAVLRKPFDKDRLISIVKEQIG